MGNLIWRGDAKAVAQVVKIIPTNPEVGDIFTIKINGKEVSFVATDAEPDTVVNGLVDAWNSAEFPEASTITAEAVLDEEGGVPYLTLTADTGGVPFRIETSTTDAGGFEILVSTIQVGVPETNEKQKVTIPSPVVSGGTFTLTFSGQTTAGIAYDANAATVQAALEALSNIAAGDVIVTGDLASGWTVEFDQAYGGTNVPALVADGTNLTGAGQVTINTTTEGTTAIHEIQQVDARADGGTYQISIKDPFTGLTKFTGSLFPSSSQPTVQAAFDSAMTQHGTGGTVFIQQSEPGLYLVEFLGTWFGENVDLMTCPDAGVVITNYQQGDPTGDNEVQRVALLWGPTGGTFTLSYDGQTTAGIAYNASAATVQAALEALSNIGAGDVSVSGSAGGPWDVTFQGALAETDVSEMTGDGSSLTGGTMTVSTTQDSDPGTNEIQSVSISPAPEGGTFTLTIDPGGGNETTAAIDYNASAATVESAIEALTSFSAGDVSVSGDAGGPWTVEFQSNFAATDMNTFEGNADNLTGGGAQDLTFETTTRSGGPNHFDDPDNWTGEAVPDSQDSLFYNGGDVDCLYGIRQRSTFTADASTDVLTFAEPCDFRENQKVRLFTTDTLPAGLSTGTDYYVLDLDYDAGTCKLESSIGNGAINITDAGTGTHTIGLHLTAINFHSRWAGDLGLTERNELEYYEYLPRSLAVVCDAITIGEGEGDGQARMDLDTGSVAATTILVHQTGGSAEAGLPAIRWKGTHASNSVTVYDGEFGAAVYATESAQINGLVQYSGLVQMGTVTLGSLTKHGGELVAENATLSGGLKLHA